MRGLLVGEDKLIAGWAFKNFNIAPYPVDRAVGIVDQDGKLLGAALFHFCTGYNVELSYYGPRTLTVGIVHILATITAEMFNASRCTVVTSKRNRRLMKSLVKLGFRLEGTQRCYFGHKDNARNTGVRFVMFRDRINQLAGLPRMKGVA